MDFDSIERDLLWPSAATGCGSTAAIADADIDPDALVPDLFSLLSVEPTLGGADAPLPALRAGAGGGSTDVESAGPLAAACYHHHGSVVTSAPVVVGLPLAANAPAGCVLPPVVFLPTAAAVPVALAPPYAAPPASFASPTDSSDDTRASCGVLAADAAVSPAASLAGGAIAAEAVPASTASPGRSCGAKRRQQQPPAAQPPAKATRGRNSTAAAAAAAAPSLAPTSDDSDTSSDDGDDDNDDGTPRASRRRQQQPAGPGQQLTKAQLAAQRRRAPEVDWRAIPDPAERRRQRRLAKNRVTAARSRERKKEQWGEMAARLAALEEENAALRARITALAGDNASLREQLASPYRGAGGTPAAEPCGATRSGPEPAVLVCLAIMHLACTLLAALVGQAVPEALSNVARAALAVAAACSGSRGSSPGSGGGDGNAVAEVKAASRAGWAAVTRMRLGGGRPTPRLAAAAA